MKPATTTAASPESAAPTEGAKLPGAFSLFESSWAAFKLNFWSFVGGAVILYALLAVPFILVFVNLATQTETTSGTSTSVNNLATTSFNVLALVTGVIAIFVISTVFVPYMYLLKLQSAKGVKVGIKANLKQCFHYFWRILGLYICRGLLIVIGFILLIVPGIWMWRRYMLSPFYLIDEDCGISEAMNKSSANTKPFAKALWGMMAVYLLMELVGLIPLLGIFISLGAAITYSCAQAVRYLQVKAA